MSYRWALLARWSTRDRLAVLVVALTVAFLTGTVVLATGVSGQVLAIAAEFGTGGTVEYVGTIDDPRVQDERTTRYVTTTGVTVDRGETAPARVVALDRRLSLPMRGGTSIIHPVASGAASGQRPSERTVGLHGPEQSVQVQLRARGDEFFPADWYLTNVSTARTLGASGGFAITSSAGGSTTAIPATGAPLRSALAFFIVGARQTLALLQVLSLGAAILAAVTVYSVTRMTIRDRTRTIRIARSTGATPRDILGVFVLRGGVLALVGTALGYAIGVILLNAAINVAVFAGVPTSLTASVSSRALGVLLPGYAVVVSMGILAGGLASYATVRRPPADVTETVNASTPPRGVSESGETPIHRRLLEYLQPSLLGWRSLVPTTSAVVVFVVLAVLLASGGGALAPLVTGGERTITEPGAVHPIASNVPQSYAAAVRSTGADASPEILAFSVVDGHAFLTRGADYPAFSEVTDATLVRGREPAGRHEAVVGADLAARLSLQPGDRVTLGGSTRLAMTRVTVVGVFTAPGAHDDQLLVSLPTARHLTGAGPSTVQFVRVDNLSASTGGTQVSVVGIDAPDRAIAGTELTVRATVVNVGDERTLDVTCRLADQQTTKSVHLEPFSRQTVSFTFQAPHPGTYQLAVDNRTATLRTVEGDSLVLQGVPPRAPPGSHPLIRVRTAAGAPVADATVTIGSRNVTTGADGRVRLPVGQPGAYTITARAGTRTAATTLTSTDQAARTLVAHLSVSPQTPSVFATPRVQATLYNPWNRTLTREVTLRGADARTRGTMRVPPGDRATVGLALGHLAPGTYSMAVRTDERELAVQRFDVTGDDRLAAALATDGYDGAASGIGQAISTIFGNLQLVVTALVGLAGVMVIGSITAALTGAVRARRRTLGIYRATGASPARVRRLVIGDALRVGVVATGVGLAGGLALAWLLQLGGLLTLYGIQLRITPSPTLLGGLAATSLGLVAVSGWLAARAVIRTEPSTLLTPAEGAWSPDE